MNLFRVANALVIDWGSGARRRDEMRVHRLAVLFGLVAVLASAPATSAAVPVTTIDIEVTFGVTLEPFTTTGGVLCASGDAISDPTFIRGGGRQGRGDFTFHVVKTMYCDNGDTFKLLVDAAGTPTGTIGGFAVGEGTGSLAGVHGGGSLVGTAFPDFSGLHDHYTGRVTIAP
jgi:hypothetical protein